MFIFNYFKFNLDEVALLMSLFLKDQILDVLEKPFSLGEDVSRKRNALG